MKLLDKFRRWLRKKADQKSKREYYRQRRLDIMEVVRNYKFYRVPDPSEFVLRFTYEVEYGDGWVMRIIRSRQCIEEAHRDFKAGFPMRTTEPPPPKNLIILEYEKR